MIFILAIKVLMLNVEDQDKAFIEGNKESASFMRAGRRSQEDKMTFCRTVDSSEWWLGALGSTLEHIIHMELPDGVLTAAFALPG